MSREHHLLLMTIQESILADKNFRASRLESLFSDFSGLKETNLEGYQANVTAWKHLLLSLIDNEQFAEQGDKISLHASSLVRQLTVSEGVMTYRPQSLPEVLDSLVNEDHSVVPYSEFVKKPVDVSGGGDGVLRRILKPVLGSAYCNGETGWKSEGKTTEKYISLGKLKSLSNALKAVLEGKAGSPLLKEHLGELSKYDSFDLECCIRYLTRDSREMNTEGDTLWLSGDKERDVEAIIGTAQLKYAIYKLEASSERRLVEVGVANERIKSLLQQKQHDMAKSELRIRKILEKQLNSQQAKLEQLKVIQLKIEEARDNVVAVQTLESNAAVLKGLNKEVAESGKIDEVLDGYSEEIAATNEISEKLGGLVPTEESDIDDELAELEKEEREKAEKEKAEKEKAEKVEEPVKESKPEKSEPQTEPEGKAEAKPEAKPVEEKPESKLAPSISDLEARFNKLKLPKKEEVKEEPEKAKPEKQLLEA